MRLVSSRSRTPSYALSDSIILTNSSLTLSFDMALSHSELSFTAMSVPSSNLKSNVVANLTALNNLNASSINLSLGCPTVLISFDFISFWPLNKSTSFPLASIARDFTVNSLAMDAKGKLVDLFNGQKDIKSKLIRTVGQPKDRFMEDALRLLRAVRFATTLDFKLEEGTLMAVKDNSEWLRAISKERVRDEFVKIIESDNAYEGVLLSFDFI